MNRAQFVDPDWAREGCPIRHTRMRQPHIDRPPRDPVTHVRFQNTTPETSGAGAAKRILQVLAKAAGPLRTPEIAHVSGGLSMQQVASNINHLHDRNAVERKRVHRGFAYTITAVGRAEL